MSKIGIYTTLPENLVHEIDSFVEDHKITKQKLFYDALQSFIEPKVNKSGLKIIFNIYFKMQVGKKYCFDELLALFPLTKRSLIYYIKPLIKADIIRKEPNLFDLHRNYYIKQGI